MHGLHVFNVLESNKEDWLPLRKQLIAEEVERTFLQKRFFALFAFPFFFAFLTVASSQEKDLSFKRGCCFDSKAAVCEGTLSPLSESD